MSHQEPISPLDQLMLNKWTEMQANLRTAEATGLHGIPETLATVRARRATDAEIISGPRLAAAVIANRDHTAAAIQPIAVVDFYPEGENHAE